jgi:hypothetical protein
MFHTPAHKAALDQRLQEQAIAAYEDAADRAMQALEDRWVDQGCSNSFDCDEDYYHTAI